jgi:hypothetical protein
MQPDMQNVQKAMNKTAETFIAGNVAPFKIGPTDFLVTPVQCPLAHTCAIIRASCIRRCRLYDRQRHSLHLPPHSALVDCSPQRAPVIFDASVTDSNETKRFFSV